MKKQQQPLKECGEYLEKAEKLLRQYNSELPKIWQGRESEKIRQILSQVLDRIECSQQVLEEYREYSAGKEAIL